MSSLSCETHSFLLSRTTRASWSAFFKSFTSSHWTKAWVATLLESDYISSLLTFICFNIISPSRVCLFRLCLGRKRASFVVESSTYSPYTPFFPQDKPPASFLHMKNIIIICKYNKIRIRKCLSIPKFSFTPLSSRSQLIRVLDCRGRKHYKSWITLRSRGGRTCRVHPHRGLGIGSPR